MQPLKGRKSWDFPGGAVVKNRLPMQGTRVRALVQEDPTCHGATKPVCHNYWACALGPACHNSWARMLQLLKPARLEPMLSSKRSQCTSTKSSPRSPQLEKAHAQQWGPNAAKNKFKKKKKKEGNPDICYNLMKLEDIMLGKISQSQKDKYCMISLIWST